MKTTLIVQSQQDFGKWFAQQGGSQRKRRRRRRNSARQRDRRRREDALRPEMQRLSLDRARFTQKIVGPRAWSDL